MSVTALRSRSCLVDCMAGDCTGRSANSTTSPLVVHNVYYVKSTRTSNRASPVEHDPACRFSILPFVADGLQDFIELSRAVARAHARLFPDEPYKDLRTLQVIALALTELIPMFWRDARTGERHQLNEMELAAAQFTRAMMDLVSVPKRRFEAVLDTMQAASLDQARASLTMRQSPRPFSVR